MAEPPPEPHPDQPSLPGEAEAAESEPSDPEQQPKKPRRQRVWRVIKWSLAAFFCILLIPIIIALSRTAIECRAFSSDPPPQAATADPLPPSFLQATSVISGYARREDRTYLTLPEWYIVYSADEYADFIAHNQPSQFPYFRAIGQFWTSYYDACGVTRERYAFDSGEHLTLAVIGASFTAENIIKGLYENTIGRVSEWFSGSEPTQEDLYAQRVAAEYGTFLHTIPWYRFPFGERLAGFWHETDLWGPHPVRKWERKIAFTMEYGVKAGYGWLIGLGTQGVYAPDELQIYTAVDGLSAQVLSRHPEIQVVTRLSDRQAVVILPRYEEFTQLVPQLTAEGIEFLDLAGNDEILITVLAPQDWQVNVPDTTKLFTLPILTQSGQQRVALNVRVRSLHSVLAGLGQGPARLEHIYDY